MHLRWRSAPWAAARHCLSPYGERTLVVVTKGASVIVLVEVEAQRKFIGRSDTFDLTKKHVAGISNKQFRRDLNADSCACYTSLAHSSTGHDQVIIGVIEANIKHAV